MKKYLATAALFLFNNEVISLVALIAIVAMFIAFLIQSAEKEAGR